MFELWTFYLSENPEKIIIWFSQKFEAAQLFPTLVIIRNVLWAANQHTLLEWFLKDHVTLNTKVMMLKIQLCITRINCILKCKMVILNCNNISKYYCFYCIFVKKMVDWWAQETPFKKKWTDLKHSSIREQIILFF